MTEVEEDLEQTKFSQVIFYGKFPVKGKKETSSKWTDERKQQHRETMKKFQEDKKKTVSLGSKMA